MSELKKLTRLGSDTKKIAALLQAKAPKGHMLAYINPQEAALLKQHGGSGKPHADTGILSFELDDSFALQGETGGLPEITDTTPPTTETYGGDIYAGQPVGLSGGFYTTPQAPAMTSGAPGMDVQLSSFPQIAEGATTPTAPAAGQIPRELERLGLEPEKAPAKGMKDETLKRLGLAGALGVLGSRTASRAGAAGGKAAGQMQQLAAPYQQAGQQLQAQAQRGELTPAAQQSLQALQAQAAQAAERRGGVGAAQSMQQVEAFRQQLLQQQYDYGLKLSGIGDNIALGAIRTGLQADQAVNQLTNSFYTNMAYIASGMTPGQPTR